MQNNSYQNKVALVTGGTSGIGKATAIAFAEAGAKVVLTGRREKEGKEVVVEIEHNGGTAAFFQADFSKDAEVGAAVDFVVATYGHLDVAFNNAGVEAGVPLSEITEEKYRAVFDINVWGVLSAMKHEIAAMLKTGGGAIVNTTSTFGHVGAARVTIYVGSKHAVEGMTKCVALEFAKQNIRVNTVSPAAIATDMIDRFAGKEGAARDALIALHPVGRLGKSEEIAAAVLYLCSDAAKFTTATSLKVDGGWLAQIVSSSALRKRAHEDLFKKGFSPFPISGSFWNRGPSSWLVPLGREKTIS
jgi:NAD(P)-dependent dehydrogenase (short-subunit alcohol dehydrogenase family)